MQIVIPGSLTDLNTYIRGERANRYLGASIKKENTDVVTQYIRLGRHKAVANKVYIVFRWYCENEKKDPDNIAFSKKYILDGLVESGVLVNDGWRQIQGFQDEFYVDKERPRIEVVLSEVVA